MLDRFLRLRSCRTLAFLAALILASVLPHAHAATGSLDAVAVAADIDHGPSSDQDSTATVHCGICHAARAVTPLPGDVDGGSMCLGRIAVHRPTAAPEGLHGQAPSRPPRGVTTA